MFARFTLAWVVLAAGLTSGADQQFVPASKLRPRNAAHFHPGLVKLQAADLQEILTLTGTDLPKDAGTMTAEWVRQKRFNTSQFLRLLDASSPTVREWAMRTMGEHAKDYGTAVPKLLAIATDRKQRDFPRALAMRVLARQPLELRTVTALAKELTTASGELRVILLETIAAAGPAGKGSVPELIRYLDAPDAATQFHIFRAVRRIEEASSKDLAAANGAHYVTARVLEQLRNRSEAAAKSTVVLRETNNPAYLTCVALLCLINRPTPEAVDVLVNRIGHSDPFVAELAGNVLDSLRELDAPGVAVLGSGVGSTNDYVRLRCLTRLRELGRAAEPEIKGVIAALERAATHGASAREVGVCADILRSFGTNAAGAPEVLVRLLEEDSPIYRDTAKHDVARLRGFLFITLAETGVPESGLAAIVSALANTDVWSVHEFAGAARAAAAAGSRATAARPHLLRALRSEIADDIIAFDRFDSHTTSNGVYTTAQIEALKALSQTGPADQTITQAVREFLRKSPEVFDNSGLGGNIPNARQEAQKTLAAMTPTHRK